MSSGDADGPLVDTPIVETPDADDLGSSPRASANEPVPLARVTYVGLKRPARHCPNCTGESNDERQRALHIKHGCPYNMYKKPVISESPAARAHRLASSAAAAAPAPVAGPAVHHVPTARSISAGAGDSGSVGGGLTTPRGTRPSAAPTPRNRAPPITTPRGTRPSAAATPRSARPNAAPTPAPARSSTPLQTPRTAGGRSVGGASVGHNFTPASAPGSIGSQTPRVMTASADKGPAPSSASSAPAATYEGGGGLSDSASELARPSARPPAANPTATAAAAAAATAAAATAAPLARAPSQRSMPAPDRRPSVFDFANAVATPRGPASGGAASASSTTPAGPNGPPSASGASKAGFHVQPTPRRAVSATPTPRSVGASTGGGGSISGPAPVAIRGGTATPRTTSNKAFFRGSELTVSSGESEDESKTTPQRPVAASAVQGGSGGSGSPVTKTSPRLAFRNPGTGRISAATPRRSAEATTPRGSARSHDPGSPSSPSREREHREREEGNASPRPPSPRNYEAGGLSPKVAGRLLHPSGNLDVAAGAAAWSGQLRGPASEPPEGRLADSLAQRLRGMGLATTPRHAAETLWSTLESGGEGSSRILPPSGSRAGVAMRSVSSSPDLRGAPPRNVAPLQVRSMVLRVCSCRATLDPSLPLTGRHKRAGRRVRPHPAALALRRQPQRHCGGLEPLAAATHNPDGLGRTHDTPHHRRAEALPEGPQVRHAHAGTHRARRRPPAVLRVVRVSLTPRPRHAG